MESISSVAEIYASAAGTIAEMWILLARHPKKGWVKKWEIGLWFVIAFGFAHVMILPNLVQSLLGEVVNLLFAWGLLEGRKSEKTLLIIGINVFMIVWAMVETRISYFISGGELVASITQGSGLPIRVIGIVFDNTLYLLIAYIVSHCFSEKLKLKKDEMVILLIFYVLFFLVVFISIAAMSDLSLNFSDRWQMTFLLLDLLMLLANFAVMRLIAHLNRQNRYEMENAILKVQIRQQGRQFSREEENYQEMRKLRHDMKRYFVTYLQLLRDGEYELVQQEMEQVLGTKLAAERFRYTENRILNAIINEKVQRCESAEIPFAVEVSIGESMEAMDIGIMVSNVLDNAIEAEEQEPKELRSIRLELWMEGEMLHVIVENYITSSVLKKNPKLETTKREREYHGIGLRGVQEYCKEQGGEMEIFEQEHTFVAHICIPAKYAKKR